jgi:uncharacterized phiE125 gp8 family phage protein
MYVITSGPPGAEPVTLDEMKRWIGLDHDADDDLISSLLPSARLAVEVMTGRVITTTGWTLRIEDGFAKPEIVLPKSPVLAVHSVEYIDAAGAPRETRDYVRRDALGLTRLVPSSWAGWWPRDWKPGSDVVVTFIAAWGLAVEDIPDELRRAVTMVAADFYENRLSVVSGIGSLNGMGTFRAPAGVEELVAPYKLASHPPIPEIWRGAN